MNHSDTVFKQFTGAMQRIGGMENKPHIAVAVSGGADSMALLWLAQRWAKQHEATVTAITIDHGLRVETQKEIELVSQLANMLAVELVCASIHLSQPGAALQEQARMARYDALENICRKRGILHLLTAHHADDNTETLAMRMWRGSGIHGLCGIPLLRHTHHLRLLRPLLGVRKEQLIQLLQENQLAWAEDASNQSLSYERNRLRHAFARLPIAATQTQSYMSAMAEAQQLLNQRLSTLASQCITAHPSGYITLDTSNWPSEDTTLLIDLLSAITTSIGVHEQPARYKKLVNSLSCLLSQKYSSFCLSGLLFSHTKQGLWRITREADALAPNLTLVTNQPAHWDQRFLVTCVDSPSLPAKLREGLSIGALGEHGLAQLAPANPSHHHGRAKLPRSVLVTLPAIWHLDQLLFVPHIGYRDDEPLTKHIHITPRWRRPLLATAHRYETTTTPIG